MPKLAKKLSPAGRELRGALAIYLAPRMAADNKLPDLASVLMSAPATNRLMQTTAIAAALKTAVSGKLAKDADIEDVVDVIQAAERVIDEAQMAEGGEGSMDPSAAVPVVQKDDDDEEEDAGGANPTKDEHPLAAKVRAFCDGKMSPEDCAKLTEMLGAELRAHDEELGKKVGEMPKNAITKEAMDAAIQDAIAQNDVKHVAITAALAKVRPVVGEIRVACDSAPSVFRKALEMKGVAVKKEVPDAGMEALFDAYAAVPATRASQPALAGDAALPTGIPSAEERFGLVRH